MVQKNVYSRLATPPAILMVATVVVLDWEMFWMLSVTAPPDAVVRSSPDARVVSVVYAGVFTDHTTVEIVAVSKNRDQSTL
jgi:hypothetical protein